MVDYVIRHDEEYDALMTDLFMNSLNIVDVDLTNKMLELLNLELPTERSTLVILVKRFVHSLGFEFLNIDTILFVWD